MGGVQQHYVIIDIIYVHMYNILKVADLWLSGADFKGILISPTNSLTFPKIEECSTVKRNFTSFAGLITAFLLFTLINGSNTKFFTAKSLKLALKQVELRGSICKYRLF